jgi:type II secretory pathway predicted ATPase ExeA
LPETNGMLAEVMEHYGLNCSFREAGYFETGYHRRISLELDAAIRRGGLIALCGIVGCGKTVLLNRTMDALQQEGEILVARSLAVDTSEVSLETLIMAMVYDLSVEEDVKLPAQAERRERLLLSLIEQCGRPVALFADDAHGLSGDTLRELTRFIERVNRQHKRLSVVLAGHPTLGDDLRHPTLEEIGTRTTLLELDDLRGQQAAYLSWLLDRCMSAETRLDDILTEEAFALLAARLITPLQIEHYLTLALEQAYRLGVKPVTAEIVEDTIPMDLNAQEPKHNRRYPDAPGLGAHLGVRSCPVTVARVDCLHGKTATYRVCRSALPRHFPWGRARRHILGR